MSGGGDFAVANNNTLCVANPFVPQELKAVSVTVPGGKLTAAALIEGISVEAINQGSEAGHLSVKFFLSKDNKLDATDLAVEEGIVWGLSKWGGVTAAKPIACDDGNPCTDDACAKATGCTTVVKTGPCDDGDACTQASACDGGVCKGGEVKGCSDGNSCTIDSCSPKTGCASVPCAGDGCGKGCDDGLACTLADQCAAGTCKAGPTKCNDNNACTTDACEAKTGACSVAPIVGCKACKLAAECDDTNDCTTDTCELGVCAWTAKSGCIGPTDPFISKLQMLAPSVQAPGAAMAKLFLTNYGKPMVTMGVKGLTFELWLSKDTTIGADDILHDTQGWPWNKALGAPNSIESFTDIAFDYSDLTKVFAGPQFACVRLIGGGDVNPANNDACAPIEVKFPAWTLDSLVLPKGDLFAEAQVMVEFSASNAATTEMGRPVGIYLSQDGAWDDKDVVIQIPNANGGMKVKAGTTVNAKAYPYLPNTATPGKPWICVVVAPALQKIEAKFADNVLCKQLDNLRNPVDLGVAAATIGFIDPAGTGYANPPFGGDYKCSLQVSNSAYTLAKAPLSVRCWVATTAPAGQFFRGDIGWGLQWKTTQDVPASYLQNGFAVIGKVNDLSVGVSAKLKPNTVGVYNVCAQLNHDGALDELVVTNNYACGKITIMGWDVFVDLPYTVIGGAVGKPQPTKLVRNVPLAMQIRICNKGNVTLTNPTKLKVRALLSKDGVASADDVVIWDKSGIPGYTKIGPAVSPTVFDCVNL
ncbi:MAG: hypothetical protein EXR77_19285 [Myxococcales bacterium]|nr:hypothetical protein [Myxococcales bacterium]